jgi:protein-S-isoprenylcysteine O-methyltransferase Ste14
VSHLPTALGVGFFLVHASVEPFLRKGRARSLARGPFDRGSSLLVSSTGVLIVVATLVAHRIGMPEATRLSRGSALLFVALLPTATLLRIWAMRELGESFTRTLEVSEDQAVVDSGPYRWIRHPGYLAQLLALCGFAGALTQSWLGPLAVCILLGTAYAYRIHAEEQMLLASRASAYRSYRARTWRLFPGLY